MGSASARIKPWGSCWPARSDSKRSSRRSRPSSPPGAPSNVASTRCLRRAPLASAPLFERKDDNLVGPDEAQLVACGHLHALVGLEQADLGLEPDQRRL